jgi:hypothetical protein
MPALREVISVDARGMNIHDNVLRDSLPRFYGERFPRRTYSEVVRSLAVIPLNGNLVLTGGQEQRVSRAVPSGAD